jgi:Spy/CpxP family protein refolding chaperone
MKKITIIIGLFFFFTAGFAQPGKEKHQDFEKYKAMKVSFMTEQLELTPQEAQQFWPIYNEFEKKRFEFHQSRRTLEEKVKKNYDKYTETEFREISYEMVDQFREEYDLMKEYNEKFLKVLPAKKVVMISPAENDFRFRMIREFREKEKEGDKK